MVYRTAAATVHDTGERAIVARITARLATPPWVIVGPGDDAAVVEAPKRTLDALTTDALVEGVHFDRRFCPPEAIGHKALAVNLSDLAAMGAAPRVATLSLVLPDDLPIDDLDGMLDGMLALAARYKVAIVGGNVTRSSSGGRGTGPGPLIIDVTAVGTVARRRILTRGGACPGDEVYVTGSIGAGVVGLRSLQEGLTSALVANSPAWRACRSRYLRPEPRSRVGMLLGRNRAATSCMDLSDGLSDAIRQVAGASRVGFAIDADALPIDDAVRQWHAERGNDPLIEAVAGGDDYELLFTSRPSMRGRLRSVRRLTGDVAVTRIGTVTRSRELVLRTRAGDRELPAGFEHFR